MQEAEGLAIIIVDNDDDTYDVYYPANIGLAPKYDVTAREAENCVKRANTSSGLMHRGAWQI